MSVFILCVSYYLNACNPLLAACCSGDESQGCRLKLSDAKTSNYPFFIRRPLVNATPSAPSIRVDLNDYAASYQIYSVKNK